MFPSGGKTVTFRKAAGFLALILGLITIGCLTFTRMDRVNNQTQEITDHIWKRVVLTRKALSLSALNSRIANADLTRRGNAAFPTIVRRGICVDTRVQVLPEE